VARKRRLDILEYHMTLSVALDRSLEERLEQVARARGIHPSEIVLQILRKELAGVSGQGSPRFKRMTDQEWRQFTEEWKNAHTSVPLLSDEAHTRESIYGEHP